MLTFTQVASSNQESRDLWVQKSISNHFEPGSTVLDIGAGTAPYKAYLSNHRYLAHDFGEYKGMKLGGTFEYADLNIKSDIANIPIEDSAIDNIICTEVLEHVPRPLDAIREMARLLKPAGKVIITAPFTSGSHQEPFHFYAGFSRYFYEYVAKEFGFDILELGQNGGFFKLMAQELERLNAFYKQIEANGFSSSVANREQTLLSLANEMCGIDQHLSIASFSIGFHVILQKQVTSLGVRGG